MLELGYLLIASLFIFGAYGHLKNHEAMVRYTTEAMGDCPVAPHIGFLGGWPTGLYLAATAALLIFQSGLGLLMGIGFLVVAALIFHRNLQDPCTFKQIALIGALVALLAN